MAAAFGISTRYLHTLSESQSQSQSEHETVAQYLLGLGGDCLADIALLPAEPSVYELTASDPTVSRTIDAQAKNDPGR